MGEVNYCWLLGVDHRWKLWLLFDLVPDVYKTWPETWQSSLSRSRFLGERCVTSKKRLRGRRKDNRDCQISAKSKFHRYKWSKRWIQYIYYKITIDYTRTLCGCPVVTSNRKYPKALVREVNTKILSSRCITARLYYFAPNKNRLAKQGLLVCNVCLPECG